MVKPLLSNEVVSNEKIILVENDKIVENYKKSATDLNNFFSNIIKSLGIPQYKDAEPVGQNISDPVLKEIIKYRSHPSIKAIKEQCNTNLYFSFSQIEHDEIMKELNNLDTNKAIQNTDIPKKLIKENSDIFANFIFENLNNCISHSIFPTSMKNAITTPVHKKGPKTSKDNLRPVSILPNISKIYDRVMFKQMSEFFEPILSKYQCGFRKGSSAQHCLLAMLEKWKSTVDNKKTLVHF